MTRQRQWLLGVTLGLGLLALLAVAALRQIPSDAELALRAEAKLEAALGVKLKVGDLHWQILPWPALVLQDLVTAQAQPISVKRLALYPALGPLGQRRIQLQRAEVDGAVLPAVSLRALGQSAAAPVAADAPGDGQAPSAWAADPLPLARLVFHDVRWISRSGIAVAYDGEADFDGGWRPRQAQLRRPGVQPATDLSLSRQGLDDRWALRIRVGGGTADGELHLQSQANGRLQLAGRLKPQQIEVASALTAFNRRAVVAGRASGDTTLSAEGANAWALARSLHSKTTFVIQPATLLRFDLDKAVRSAGREHAGQTVLESLSGQLDSQNTAHGLQLDFSALKARSGALSASGQATLLNRHIEAEFAVDLVDGLLGVPLKVSGPVEQVKVSVPGGALAGAALGTAVLPGVGTAIGARLGAALGKLFSPAPERKASSPAK